MNKDEIIALLQQQISFLQEQLQEANRKADALLEEVTSLRNMLEHKSEEVTKQKRIIKGLAKITANKSEKQPSTPAAPQDAAACQSSEKKERARTNNGAKRKQHLEVEFLPIPQNGKVAVAFGMFSACKEKVYRLRGRFRCQGYRTPYQLPLPQEP